MNWNRISGNWKWMAGRAKEKWGVITHNDRLILDGQVQQLKGRFEDGYGSAKEKIAKVAGKL